MSDLFYFTLPRRLQNFLITLYKRACSFNLLSRLSKIQSGLHPIVYTVIMFFRYRLGKLLRVVFNPFRTWLQNYGTLFRIFFEFLSFWDFKRKILQYMNPFSSLKFSNVVNFTIFVVFKTILELEDTSLSLATLNSRSNKVYVSMYVLLKLE